MFPWKQLDSTTIRFFLTSCQSSKHHPRHLFYNPQPACQTTFTHSIPCRCKNIRDSPVSLVRAYLTSFSLFSAGRIDHGHHDGMAIRALTDTVALNKAVAKAIDIVNKGNIWFNYFTVLIDLDNTTSFRSKFGQIMFVKVSS